jgi:CheY-like chemotaxis protein
MSVRREILVVDDDATFRSIIGEVLKAEGCTVREASNGREALRMARAHVPDLILTDLMMPTMTGWELCAALEKNERLARIPVAIMSGTRGPSPRGARFLNKPVAVPELVESVLPP